MYEENYNLQDTEGLNSFFKKTYGIMALALIVSAITGYVVQNYFYNTIASLINNHPLILIGFIVAEFVLAGMIGHTANSPAIAGTLLTVFSILQGMFLGIILMMYTPASIFGAFISAAALFAGMAIWGVVTNKDLSGWGSILFGAVIALVITSVINLIFFNNIVSLIISAITIVVFSLYTAYDNQNIKEMYYNYADNNNALNGLAIFGALQLYLDFINIFLSILRIFGRNN